MRFRQVVCTFVIQLRVNGCAAACPKTRFRNRNLLSDAKLSRMENGIQISDDELELLVTAVAFLRACLKEGLPKLESSGKYFHGVPDLADVTALYERLGNEARQRFLPISGQHIM